MRRLSLIRSAATPRGGWIVFEYLREFGCLAVLLTVAVGVLHQLTPQPAKSDAAALATQCPVYGVGLVDDGRKLWINRYGAGLVLVDLESLTELSSLCYLDSRLTDADVSAMSPTLLSVTSDQFRLRFVRGDGYGHEAALPASDGLLGDIRVQADGNAVVAVTSTGMVATWTWNGAGFDVRRDPVEGAALTLAELSADGRWAALIADNEDVLMFDRKSGLITARWRAHKVRCSAMAFSADGQRLATGGSDGLVRVWDRSSGKLVWEANADILGPAALKFSTDGRRLASGGFDKAVRVWNAADGHLLTTLGAHSGAVRALAFHPDGNRLYSGSLHGELLEWSLAGQSVLRSIR
ncbi:MAG TPA: WD40 repeat domain-containing protein [Planctomycetaceae bacterium]|nr:WD40 repeat domain-containing protein [Planctomycetaceae bacterium]